MIHYIKKLLRIKKLAKQDSINEVSLVKSNSDDFFNRLRIIGLSGGIMDDSVADIETEFHRKHTLNHDEGSVISTPESSHSEHHHSYDSYSSSNSSYSSSSDSSSDSNSSSSSGCD